MTYIIYLIPSIVFAVYVFFGSKRQLHMAQLEGYKPRQYWWWIKHNIRSLVLKDIAIVLTSLVLLVVCSTTGYNDIFQYVSIILWGAVTGYVLYHSQKGLKEAKKPLRFTHRAIRLFVLNLVLLCLWAFLSYLSSDNMAIFMLLLSVIIFALPLNMLLSVIAIYPAEMLIQFGYFKDAQKKISAMKNLKVIGITGSYGKTSTKYFVKTILSEKYNTIMTPESYNTPMGITRVIREQLKEEHEVFVCEMGARNVGDIKTLCKLASPSIGILTSIGPQHLETFKSIENVAKTKYELIEALPYDGTAIFNGDNNFCLDLARKTGIETFIYGVNNRDEDIYIYAEDVKNSKDGLRFRVKGKGGIDFECRTSLLGKHNVSNLLGAICAALKLGLTPEEIQLGITKIKSVPHRLELLDTQNGVTVIDDAFNSNPEGAKEALETIKDMTDGSRIVVTPGMVELGTAEYEENKKFGRIMAECCDYAILVGVKRSKPIVEGLRTGNFPEDRIIIASNLDEATKRLGHIVKAGDVVLFENDLPDNYDE